jgi:hypothetical protein
MSAPPDPTAAAESHVDLPPAVEGDFDVYVNGILQQPGSDYRLDGRTLVFPRPLVREVKMSKLQLLRAALGIAGTYNKYDSVDVTFRAGGRNQVATGLQPRPGDGGV